MAGTVGVGAGHRGLALISVRSRTQRCGLRSSVLETFCVVPLLSCDSLEA